MVRIIGALAEVAGQYDTLFCDLWGCVHDGTRAYPAAVAALQDFRQAGGRVVLMTNAPRPEGSVARQINRLGVPRDSWDVIVTSGDAAQAGMMMGAVGRQVWHLGPDKDESFFSDVPKDVAALGSVERVDFKQAEGIVCTGLFDDLNEGPEDYRARLLAAKTREMKLLCANPDIVVDYGNTRIFCAGAIAALYEDMGGESLYFGKPHPPIYDLARRKLAALGHDPREVLAIGDGIDTDIAGGQAEGIDTMFITGGLAAEAFGPDVENPDSTRLDAWLATQTPRPTLAIGRLR
jgi:HAD superfamily hydrolase (TIGR01459 family)